MACITLSVSNCVGYDVADPHSYSLSVLLAMYYNHRSISRESRLLLPLPGTFLQCDVLDCSPACGTLTKETEIHFSYPENEPILTHHYSKEVHHLIDAILYTLGLKPLGNKTMQIHGAIVCGGSGSGKTTVLKEIVKIVNSFVPHSAVFTSASDIDPSDSKFDEPRSIRVFCVDDVDSTAIPSKSHFGIPFSLGFL